MQSSSRSSISSLSSDATGEELADARLVHAAPPGQQGLGGAGLRHHLLQQLPTLTHVLSIARGAMSPRVPTWSLARAILIARHRSPEVDFRIAQGSHEAGRGPSEGTFAQVRRLQGQNPASPCKQGVEGSSPFASSTETLPKISLLCFYSVKPVSTPRNRNGHEWTHGETAVGVLEDEGAPDAALPVECDAAAVGVEDLAGGWPVRPTMTNEACPPVSRCGSSPPVQSQLCGRARRASALVSGRSRAMSE